MYFKTTKKLPVKQVTEQIYIEEEDKQITMLKKMELEPDPAKKQKIVTSQVNRIKSKSLLTAILSRFNGNLILKQINEQKGGLVLLGITTFIICFEKFKG